MRVTIITFGSHGDLLPFVALGSGLKAAGHQVRIATHAPFESLVRGRGLDCFPLRGDPRELLKTEAGHDLQESGRNPLLYLRRFSALIGPLVESLLTDAWTASQDADVIIHSTFAFIGYRFAEILGIPSFAAFPTPVTRTRAFPVYPLPSRLRLGGAVNWLSYLAGEQLFWQTFRPIASRWLRTHLNQRRLPLFGPWPVARFDRPDHPVLYFYSEAVLPRPSDWGDWIHVTGYWFPERAADWHPPQGLVDFLADGPKPICIGFGSFDTRDPQELTEIVLRALSRTRQRGVLVTAWGGLRKGELPDTVYSIDYVPYDWLLPQAAAIVHHGGQGTVGISLRAGVPCITVPFSADHPFWSERVAALGVGPTPIPPRQLSADRLAGAIQAVATDVAMQQRTRALGERLRREDGVARAIEVIHRFVE